MKIAFLLTVPVEIVLRRGGRLRDRIRASGNPSGKRNFPALGKVLLDPFSLWKIRTNSWQLHQTWGIDRARQAAYILTHLEPVSSLKTRRFLATPACCTSENRRLASAFCKTAIIPPPKG